MPHRHGGGERPAESTAGYAPDGRRIFTAEIVLTGDEAAYAAEIRKTGGHCFYAPYAPVIGVFPDGAHVSYAPEYAGGTVKSILTLTETRGRISKSESPEVFPSPSVSFFSSGNEYRVLFRTCAGRSALSSAAAHTLYACIAVAGGAAAAGAGTAFAPACTAAGGAAVLAGFLAACAASFLFSSEKKRAADEALRVCGKRPCGICAAAKGILAVPASAAGIFFTAWTRSLHSGHEFFPGLVTLTGTGHLLFSCAVPLAAFAFLVSGASAAGTFAGARRAAADFPLPGETGSGTCFRGETEHAV